MNFKEWISMYYTVYKKLELKPGTLRSYLTCLSRIPDSWELESITREDIQKLINDLSLELSTSTVKHIFTVISQSITDAPLYGFADVRSALFGIRLPKQRKKHISSLSPAELERIYNALKVWPKADVYIALLNSGLRFSELAGLNCGDIDFAGKSYAVYKNYYRGILQDSTKTDDGVRDMPLNFALFSIFRQNVIVGKPKAPLFRNSRGNRLSYNTILNDWHSLCDCAGVRRCGLHVLRHTFATELFKNRVDIKTVSALLGHKSITITADIYTDVPFELKQRAVMGLHQQDQHSRVL